MIFQSIKIAIFLQKTTPINEPDFLITPHFAREGIRPFRSSVAKDVAHSSPPHSHGHTHHLPDHLPSFPHLHLPLLHRPSSTTSPAAVSQNSFSTPAPAPPPLHQNLLGSPTATLGPNGRLFEIRSLLLFFWGPFPGPDS